MSDGNDQRRFVFLKAHLILYAYARGYELSDGDAWAKEGHSENSFHYKRLAQDFNLFRDRMWLTKTEDHRFLGEFWKSLDPKCSWGGDFKREDGNHYSYGE